MSKNDSHLVIIGNGISGITCARHVRKASNIPITVISSETEHFYARTALMYIYMGHMKYEHTKPYEDHFWAKNNIELIHARAEQIDTAKQTVTIPGRDIPFSQLVIATGSVSRLPELEGVDAEGVHTLYSIQDLEKIEQRTKEIKNAVIAGGGLIGIELAEMLLSRGIKVTMLVREDRYWGSVLPKDEADMIARHMNEHGISLLLETEIAEIEQENGKVRGVKLKNGQQLPCQFLGITIGVAPNMKWLSKSGIETDKGVLVDTYFETNVPGIYAIGDCAQYRTAPTGRKDIEQIWYTGRIHGQTLAQTLCGTPTTYNPGVWFNSAKFLDIEYQTYGNMPAEAESENAFFYWEDAGRRVALRLHYERSTQKLLGAHSLGIRLRQAVLNDWLQKYFTIEEAIIHLADAVFDPEFQKDYIKDIAIAYNKTTGAAIKPKKKSWLRLLGIKSLQHD